MSSKKKKKGNKRPKGLIKSVSAILLRNSTNKEHPANEPMTESTSSKGTRTFDILHHHITIHEQEIRALALQLATVKFKVSQHLSDISALHEDIAAISQRSQRLAVENEALSKDNAFLRHIAEQAIDNGTARGGASIVNHTDVISEDSIQHSHEAHNIEPPDGQVQRHGSECQQTVLSKLSEPLMEASEA